MSPLGAFLKGCVDLSGIDKNIESGKLIAAALSATSYSEGSTVTFVHGASSVQMWRRTRRYSVKAKLTNDHVLASSAIPFAALNVPVVCSDCEGERHMTELHVFSSRI